MWETLVKPPLGRLSVRKFIMLLTTLVVACFMYTLALAPTAHAADPATWNGDQITYNGRTYTSAGTSDGENINIPEGAAYFTSVDTSANPDKAYVIYFAPGNSPPSEKAATLVTFNYANGVYSAKSSLTSVTMTPQQTAASSEGTKSCNSDEGVFDGIGWAICPITNALAKGMDYVYNAITAYLTVQPLATTSNQAMFRAWDYMRNVANIVFVMGFLVVIYSQLTGLGLNNYAIKKMLPRVIVAAILVNTSYWICAIAIDIFNVLGYSIQDIFISVRNSLVGSEGNSWDVISWEKMAGLILSGGTIATGVGVGSYLGITSITTAVAGAGSIGAGISGLFYLFLPILLAVLFVVLMTFLILAARQAIITILVVLAPLAFVAYLLPNTEEWFTKWRKALFTLLLVFPAFSVVFGGSQLAASIIIQNATDLNMILLAMGVQVAPLAIMPLLLKLGGGVLNRVAGVVNNPAKGVFDRSKTWAKDHSEANKARGLAALSRRADDKKYKDGLPSYSGDKKDFKTRALRRGAALNPANMAWRREYKRRELEDMKASHTAATDGYYAGTTAATRADEIKRNAGIVKHQYEGRNYENWAAKTYGDPSKNIKPNEFGHRHHSGGVAEGAAKIYEEAANKRVERDLQGRIHNAADLRGLKVQANVDSDHADFLAKNVAAEGKAVFQNQVMADKALRNMNVQTSNFEKEAATISNTLQKRADANWNNLSATDARVQTLRFDEIRAEGNAKHTEAQFNEIVSDVKARGADATGYLAVRENHRGQMVRDDHMANTIRYDDQGTKVTEKRIAEHDNIANKNADAAWHDLMVRDNETQNLRMRSTAATDSAQLAESRATRVIEDARKNGSASTLVKGAANAALADNLQTLAVDNVGAAKAVDHIKAEVQSRAETAFIKSDDGKRLNREAQAAKDSLDAANTEEESMIKELRTEEGIRKHEQSMSAEELRTATELMEADVMKRAQAQRGNAATTVANNEYAAKVKKNGEDAVDPDAGLMPDGSGIGVATIAGGIRDGGVSQAKAAAVKTTFDTFDSDVGAERTLVSRNESEDIMKNRFTDATGQEVIGLGDDKVMDSEERLAALVSMVAKRPHQESHIKLWSRLGALRRVADDDMAAAEASGDEQAIKDAGGRVSAIRSAQQQLMADKTKLPFGIGAYAQGQADIGLYNGDVYELTRKRIDSDLSVKTLSEMDPDDMTLIFEMARADKLSADQLGIIADTYEAWQDDPNYKQLLKPKFRPLLDPIFEHARTGRTASTYHTEEGKFPDVLTMRNPQ